MWFDGEANHEPRPWRKPMRALELDGEQLFRSGKYPEDGVHSWLDLPSWFRAWLDSEAGFGPYGAVHIKTNLDTTTLEIKVKIRTLSGKETMEWQLKNCTNPCGEIFLGDEIIGEKQKLHDALFPKEEALEILDPFEPPF